MPSSLHGVLLGSPLQPWAQGPRGATAMPSHGGEGMCSYGERKSRMKEMGGPGAEHTCETPKGLEKNSVTTCHYTIYFFIVFLFHSM